jgi:hypothetical protein
MLLLASVGTIGPNAFQFFRLNMPQRATATPKEASKPPNALLAATRDSPPSATGELITATNI